MVRGELFDVFIGFFRPIGASMNNAQSEAKGQATRTFFVLTLSLG